MRATQGLAVLAAAWVACAGCAGFRVVPHPDPDAEGLRFWRPEPYLLVTTETTEKETEVTRKPTATIVWLPAQDGEYAIQTWAVLAKGDFAFTLSNGWMLTSTSEKTDATSAISDLLGIVKQGTAAGGIIAPKAAVAPGAKALPVQLYKIAFGPDGSVALQPVEVK